METKIGPELSPIVKLSAAGRCTTNVAVTKISKLTFVDQSSVTKLNHSHFAHGSANPLCAVLLWLFYLVV